MTRVGEYVILHEGEEGPLGKLLLAEHCILKRKVALKQLAFSLEDASMQQLESQVASIATLEHPSLARLQNVGFEDGSCYCAYDWIASNDAVCLNLRDYTKQKGISEEALFSVGIQVASALDKIHSQGMIHLGVKASNVLVDASSKDLKVYLTDTGLAHLFPAGLFMTKLLQECMKKMGTNADLSSFWESFYALAPEQRLGGGQIESDVYAFGVMLYKQLMGVFPIGKFIMPSEKGFLSYKWDLFLSACLHPDPSFRPKELVKALEGIQPGVGSTEPSFTLQLKPQEINRPQFEADPGAVFQTEAAIVKYQPQEEQYKQLDPIATKMVLIPGGSFCRGSNKGARDESPRHLVHIAPFAMDIHLVTNEQFVRFLEIMGGEKDGNNNDMIRLKESRIKRSAGRVHIESGYSQHPVVGVTWYGAIAYAKWVGKRLPTEAEWEIAACGGMEDPLYPTGQTIEKLQANFFSSDTTAVMSYPSNGHGLYDMAGNVYEWCSDWYDYHYYDTSMQEPNNPKGPAQGVYRILRGGCWKSLREDMRCSHRHRNNPGATNSTYGFRCVADVSSS
jgi:formylglycine-generating enzyme required for sulfatase activity